MIKERGEKKKICHKFMNTGTLNLTDLTVTESRGYKGENDICDFHLF